MYVKPNLSYRLLGTSYSVVAGKTYKATHATNMPNWKERKLIFINDLLLEEGEYEVVRNKKKNRR